MPVLSGLAGREGTAATVLRPSGKVVIDGEWYDGISESGFIEKGATVSVVRYENAQVYVARTESVARDINNEDRETERQRPAE